MYLFDLDGTLIDSNGIWAEVDRTFLARRGYPYTKEYYEGVAHTIFPLAAVFTKEYCHLSESTDEIMAEWMELAKDNYAHVALKPHVREYLEKLRAQGERMLRPRALQNGARRPRPEPLLRARHFRAGAGHGQERPGHFRQGDGAARRHAAGVHFLRRLGQVLPQRQGERHDGHRRVRPVFRGHEGRNAARLRPLHPRLWRNAVKLNCITVVKKSEAQEISALRSLLFFGHVDAGGLEHEFFRAHLLERHLDEPQTMLDELKAFVQSLKAATKTG